MKIFFSTALLVFSLSLSLHAQVLEGGVGLRHQVDKYLMDHDRDPSALRQSGTFRVVARGPVETLVSWEVSGVPAPTLADLDSVTNSFTVLITPLPQLKKVGGKYVVKSVAEIEADQAASPEGVRKTKRNGVRASLRTELVAAGFTNSVYTLDDVQVWLENASLATGPEKKINKLVSQLQSLSLPVTPVSVNE